MLLYDYVIKFKVIMYAQLLLSYNLDSNTGQTEVKFLNWSWAMQYNIHTILHILYKGLKLQLCSYTASYLCTLPIAMYIVNS